MFTEDLCAPVCGVSLFSTTPFVLVSLYAPIVVVRAFSLICFWILSHFVSPDALDCCVWTPLCQSCSFLLIVLRFGTLAVFFVLDFVFPLHAPSYCSREFFLEGWFQRFLNPQRLYFFCGISNNPLPPYVCRLWKATSCIHLILKTGASRWGSGSSCILPLRTFSI